MLTIHPDEGVSLRLAWVHLRLRLHCGHVGCYGSFPNRHARRHAFGIGPRVVRTSEAGEDWRWCYADEAFV